MRPALILHGGAWNWPDELDAPKAKVLEQAVALGWDILSKGGSALDAVEKATNILEDAPLFDAGIGSHLNAQGLVEMDALIVNGTAHTFGAVGAVQRTRYPVSLARRIMEETTHNFFVGKGADQLAQRFRLEMMPNIEFVTPEELQLFRQRQQPVHSSDFTSADTVGAVALDESGNIAAATSTGGTPMKPAGRVGDSPIYGAGGFADSAYGGASATGLGEHVMRVLLSKYAIDQIALTDKTAQQAANACEDLLNRRFGQDSNAGIIIIDQQGHIGIGHTTPKIAAAWVDADGNIRTTMRKGV